MTDGPMYWSSNDQAGWYQSQPPADPSIAPPPPHHQPNAYQPGYHQMHGRGAPPLSQTQQMSSDHPSPGPQTMMNGPTANECHAMQSNMPPQATQPPVNNYNQHHMSTISNVMHDPPNQQQQTMPVPQPPQSQMQNLESSGGYSYAQPAAPTQMYSHPTNTSPNHSYAPPPQNLPLHSNGGLSHGQSPVSSMHQQSTAQQQQHQQQPQQSQSIYPVEQYSPAPYWNPGPPPPPPPPTQPPIPQHQGPGYAPPGPHGQPHPPPQQSSPMMHHQGTVSTPPTLDGPTNYPMTNGVLPGPIQQQPLPPPNSTNMPYDSRGSGYGSPYQPQPSSYYGSQDHSHAYESQSVPSHQHQQPISGHQPQTNWSNGYYQQNSSSYTSGPNHYSNMSPSYNGLPPQNHTQNRVQAPPNHISGGGPQSSNQHQHQHHHQIQQHQAPPMHHLQNGGMMPPSQHHYGSIQHNQHLPLSHATSHHPQQQQQRWPVADQLPPNHAMAISDRNIKGVPEKRPVKTRAPRQRNPNAPSGRRKDPVMTKEHKRSGYAQFFKLKRKELDQGQDNKFGDYSKTIADLWQQLSDEEKATYSTEVNNKRKEMLKKKASQQAQDLVQGIKQE